MITVVGLFVMGVGIICLVSRSLGAPDHRVWPPWGPSDR